MRVHGPPTLQSAGSPEAPWFAAHRLLNLFGFTTGAFDTVSRIRHGLQAFHGNLASTLLTNAVRSHPNSFNRRFYLLKQQLFVLRNRYLAV